MLLVGHPGVAAQQHDDGRHAEHDRGRTLDRVTDHERPDSSAARTTRWANANSTFATKPHALSRSLRETRNLTLPWDAPAIPSRELMLRTESSILPPNQPGFH